MERILELVGGVEKLLVKEDSGTGSDTNIPPFSDLRLQGREKVGNILVLIIASTVSGKICTENQLFR